MEGVWHEVSSRVKALKAWRKFRCCTFFGWLRNFNFLSLNFYTSFFCFAIINGHVLCAFVLHWLQCGQNIMGPKHHLKAQKHQPKTPPKKLKKHHFLGKKHHIFFKNLSKMTLPWIFIAFLCINFWKIFTVKLKFSKNFKKFFINFWK